MLHYRFHCLCSILYPSVHISLFMFHRIFFSPHFIDHVSLSFHSVHCPSHSFHLSRFISFIFALFGCIHITWPFNDIVSLTLSGLLILDRYSLLEAGLRWFHYSLSLCIGREIQRLGVAWVFWLLCWSGVGVLFYGASGWGGSAGLFAAGLGSGGGLISVPYKNCEGFVLNSASYLRFSVSGDTTYI